MFINRFFAAHRNWEDWFGMLLGLLIAVSPWVATGHVSRAGAWNAVLIGVLVFFMLFRLQSRIPVGNRVVLRGAFMGAVGFGVLKYLGAELASGAGNNPLMAGFAVIIGLMIWFNLVMQWLLLTTAWIATGPRSDRG